jgi:hypothetical protein
MNNPSKRRGSRVGQRGAAMVEGIVIMTTMLVFLGMNVWVGKAYGGKLDQMNSTRRDVLYFASHSCRTQNDLDPDTYTAPQLAGVSGGGMEPGDGSFGGEVPPAAERSGAQIENGVGGGLSASVDKSWNTATAGKGKTPVNGQAIVNTTPQQGINLSKVGLSAQLGTESATTCNERSYNNAWTALFSFGWDFLKSAAGGG